MRPSQRSIKLGDEDWSKTLQLVCKSFHRLDRREATAATTTTSKGSKASFEAKSFSNIFAQNNLECGGTTAETKRALHTTTSVCRLSMEWWGLIRSELKLPLHFTTSWASQASPWNWLIAFSLSNWTFFPSPLPPPWWGVATPRSIGLPLLSEWLLHHDIYYSLQDLTWCVKPVSALKALNFNQNLVMPSRPRLDPIIRGWSSLLLISNGIWLSSNWPVLLPLSCFLAGLPKVFYNEQLNEPHPFGPATTYTI